MSENKQLTNIYRCCTPMSPPGGYLVRFVNLEEYEWYRIAMGEKARRDKAAGYSRIVDERRVIKKGVLVCFSLDMRIMISWLGRFVTFLSGSLHPFRSIHFYYLPSPKKAGRSKTYRKMLTVDMIAMNFFGSLHFLLVPLMSARGYKTLFLILG